MADAIDEPPSRVAQMLLEKANRLLGVSCKDSVDDPLVFAVGVARDGFPRFAEVRPVAVDLGSSAERVGGAADSLVRAGGDERLVEPPTPKGGAPAEAPR